MADKEKGANKDGEKLKITTGIVRVEGLCPVCGARYAIDIDTEDEIADVGQYRAVNCRNCKLHPALVFVSPYQVGSITFIENIKKRQKLIIPAKIG